MGVKLKERILAKGVKRYYLVIWNNGNRSYEWLHTVEKGDDKRQKKKLAENIRAQRALEIESEGTNFVPKHKKKITISQYFDYYIKNYKQKDIRTIEGALNKFQEYLKKPKLAFSSLTKLQIEKFKHYLVHESGLNGETPYSYWRRFKKVLIHAEKEGYISESVYKHIRWESKNKKAETTLTKQVLTEEEITKLKDTRCGNNEVKRAFLFACYTGLGYAEFKKLTWKNIVNKKLIIDRAKTNSEINIKLSNSALHILGERKKGLIFDLKHEGKFLSDTAINKNLRNWVGIAEIEKDITFYCGRHTFAVRLLMNGANLKTVSDALGHKTSAHTIKYLNHVNSLKDDATFNLD
ncbi:tyrosine-type recombinase/integrase [Algibacter luteus]|uniref:Site-specific recombinase XerD n=1 Tax=Algibacter luteus TaxID=1178825 RepID=A0A1M6DM26_9FLAO|nr:site-specific integrase [Algibacter luteus]SHI74306.1 Site-specific recombinase XerD [Algibacter luteus]